MTTPRTLTPPRVAMTAISKRFGATAGAGMARPIGSCTDTAVGLHGRLEGVFRLD